MAPTTVQQERRELWNAILDEVGQRDPDPARAAACFHLLDHLIRSAIPPDFNATPRALRHRGAGAQTIAPRPCYGFTGTTSSKMFGGN